MPEANETAKPRSQISVSTLTILKVVAIFLVLYFLYIIRDIILLLLVSFILSSALTPLVDWLYHRLRVPRGLTVVLVYVVFIGFVVLTISLLVPRLIADFGSLGGAIEEYRNSIVPQGTTLSEIFSHYGLSNFLQNLSNSLSSFASSMFEKTIGLFSGIFNFISVLVISFYLVIQKDAIRDVLKMLAPVRHHKQIGQIVVQIQRRLGQWLLGQLGLMLSIFILTYIGLLILGVKYALVLALLAGLLEVVPYLGPIISSIPAAFVALLQSPMLALGVLVLYTLIQQIENYLLAPRILGKSIGANSLVVLIALLIGYKIAGVIGMLIAAPLVAIAAVVAENREEIVRTFRTPEEQAGREIRQQEV